MEEGYVLKRNIDITGKVFFASSNPLVYECVIETGDGQIVVQIPKSFLDSEPRLCKKDMIDASKIKDNKLKRE